MDITDAPRTPPEADEREQYSQCVALIGERMFDDAVLLLRNLVAELEGRDRNAIPSKEFMLQEIGALRLLVHGLEGLGRDEEARRKEEEVEMKQLQLELMG
ncbi:unnamed protein product [Zymoseptoria tritici ST99CH_1A5]|uniref:Uncharacterized protein n=1 Tax=Zymoseptoria tritici ST99CH_1A5 TaxID=1276529 RepID=A0A1Y6LQR1_ZYMTR|nr:unnamed protein product [Zymoseptoria tritici ST99CH_1A5]